MGHLWADPKPRPGLAALQTLGKTEPVWEPLFASAHRVLERLETSYVA